MRGEKQGNRKNGILTSQSLEICNRRRCFSMLFFGKSRARGLEAFMACGIWRSGCPMADAQKGRHTRGEAYSGWDRGVKKPHPKMSRVFLQQTGWLGSLYAAGGLGQASHFTGSFAGPGGKQFIDVLQLEAGYLGKNAHHGSDAVLLVVILKEVDDFLVFFSDVLDAFLVFHVVHPCRVPIVKALQETVFVNFEGFALKFNCSHELPP
eukprot:TRINITY_DN9620_c0_g1_i1.p2 TRINITY_DN9620_c0_g1~~TRINITY_DN9620_c0_g1_i1.p2  ORF type:complete len:208 (+),score=9.73 TRINITY_DN9620_c0_g1_i1:107-730(+)